MIHRRNMIQAVSFVIMLLLCGLAPGWATPQDVMNDKPTDTGKVEAGYAIITPVSPTKGAAGLVVFETYGEHRMGEVAQAGVLPSDMTTHCLLYVSSSGRLSKNLGIAIANPGKETAKVSLLLRNEAGTVVGTSELDIKANYQVARFVTELFPSQTGVPQDFTGTLEIISNPISSTVAAVPIAVVGLRFRGQNFSTLPVTNLSLTSIVVPASGDVGGEGAIILAHVATGGGWATEIVIANTSKSDIFVRVDLFNSAGALMNATFNGKPSSSFTNLKVPAMGVVTLSQDDEK